MPATDGHPGEYVLSSAWVKHHATANYYLLFPNKFIAQAEQRQEILDWFHLVENLHKMGGSRQRLATVEALLWKGDVDGAIEQFKDWQHQQVDNFVAYLRKHRHRIVNYGYFQAEGISIGSGTIESTVKQIGGRIKLSGVQ